MTGAPTILPYSHEYLDVLPAELYAAVPRHLVEGLDEYIKAGRPMGGFLTAFFANDLRETLARGDPNSLAGLRSMMNFVFANAPIGCFGSYDIVHTWQRRGGIRGGAHLRLPEAEHQSTEEGK